MTAVFSRASVQEQLLKIFGNYSQPGTSVSEESHITGDLGIDSLSVMEIVAELEDTFALTFPDEELPSIRTVGDVIRTVSRRLQDEGRLS